MATSRQLDAAARRLAELLKRRQLRAVFAESCTGGLISAVLAKIPGISEFHCGSAVVYRIGTKHEWLGISVDVLDDPGPVSRVVAAEMAARVLSRTPEADVAASVTGHLGPGAPARQDGLIYVGVAQRGSGGRDDAVTVRRFRLAGGGAPMSAAAAKRLRVLRQRAAAKIVFDALSARLNR